MIKARPAKTVDDYLKLPEGTRAELIEGELFMSPSPKFRHQQVVSNLHFALRQFAMSRKLGVVVDSPMDVHLPSGDVVQPDVLFVAEGRRTIIVDWIRGVPDLMVEVVSPESSERDRIVKRHLYEQNGVQEYWLVDPEERSVEVLTLTGSRYASHGYFVEGDSVDSAILKGFSIPVRDIFA